MTTVDLLAVYRAADKIRLIGMSAGTALTAALAGIDQAGVADACGSDEMGSQVFQGYLQLRNELTGAGELLGESLINIGDGVSGGANLLAQTDGQNADAIKAADLGLQSDGKALPPDPAKPST